MANPSPPRYKDVGHPLGWRPTDPNHPFYAHGPRNWASDYTPNTGHRYVPGDKAKRVAHSGKCGLWRFAPTTVPAEFVPAWGRYAHRCQFWAVPLLEAARKAIDKNATAADVAELRKYVDIIGDWK